MEQMVYNTIKQYNLINLNDNIIVGVSGGPDSMMLLHVLKGFKEYMNFNIFVAHINHGVRGKDADNDEKFVENICERWNLPFYSKKVNMDEYAKLRKISSEEAGREIRYNFFREIANKIGNAKIAVAHNKNDQVETAIMRFIRGTGIDGLKGMDYINGDIIRPVLDIERDKIEKYCEENNIEYRTDWTNNKPIYGRNKIRLELIPYIEENLNNGLINTVYRTTQIMRTDSNFLNECAYRAYKKVLKRELNDNIVLYTDMFNDLHDALKSRIIRICINKIKGNIKGLQEKHIRYIIDIANKNTTGNSIDIIKGIKVIVKYQEIVIGKKSVDSLKKNKRFKLRLNNGKNHIKELDSVIECKIISANKVDIIVKDNFIKYFDYDKINNVLYLRNRNPGDRFNPLGMKGSKKLKDFFIDEKVLREERDTIPLVCDGDNIIWVVGYRISESYKIDSNTKNILMVKYYKN